jgi:hypothetical protein
VSQVFGQDLDCAFRGIVGRIVGARRIGNALLRAGDDDRFGRGRVLLKKREDRADTVYGAENVRVEDLWCFTLADSNP